MKKRVSATKLYRLWESIKARCYNSKRSENNRNKRIRRDNTTGYKGVTRHKQTGKYNYEIQIDGIRYRKSGFLTAKEAYNARLVKVEQIKSML